MQTSVIETKTHGLQIMSSLAPWKGHPARAFPTMGPTSQRRHPGRYGRIPAAVVSNASTPVVSQERTHPKPKTIFWKYWWWTKSCTTKDDDYPTIYRVSYIPGGAGFLPSTVLWHLYRAPEVSHPCHALLKATRGGAGWFKPVLSGIELFPHANTLWALPCEKEGRSLFAGHLTKGFHQTYQTYHVYQVIKFHWSVYCSVLISLDFLLILEVPTFHFPPWSQPQFRCFCRSHVHWCRQSQRRKGLRQRH